MSKPSLLPTLRAPVGLRAFALGLLYILLYVTLFWLLERIFGEEANILSHEGLLSPASFVRPLVELLASASQLPAWIVDGKTGWAGPLLTRVIPVALLHVTLGPMLCAAAAERIQSGQALSIRGSFRRGRASMLGTASFLCGIVVTLVLLGWGCLAMGRLASADSLLRWIGYAFLPVYYSVLVVVILVFVVGVLGALLLPPAAVIEDEPWWRLLGRVLAYVWSSSLYVVIQGAAIAIYAWLVTLLAAIVSASALEHLGFRDPREELAAVPALAFSAYLVAFVYSGLTAGYLQIREEVDGPTSESRRASE